MFLQYYRLYSKTSRGHVTLTMPARPRLLLNTA